MIQMSERRAQMVSEENDDQAHELIALLPERPQRRYMELITADSVKIGTRYRSRRTDFSSSMSCPNGCPRKLEREVLDYEWPTGTNPVLFIGIVGYQCGCCKKTFVPDSEENEMRNEVDRVTGATHEKKSASASRTKVTAQNRIDLYK